jgi:hypothetical protein
MRDFDIFERAIEVCANTKTFDPLSPANMLTIKSAREQAFIQNYIFSEMGVTDSVWLGITRVNYTLPFLWLDDRTTLNETYSNWGPGRVCIHF